MNCNSSCRQSRILCGQLNTKKKKRRKTWVARIANRLDSKPARNSLDSRPASNSPAPVTSSTSMEVPVVEVTSPFQITTSCPEAGITSLGGVAAVEAVVVLKTSSTWYKRVKKSEQGKV